MKQSSRNSNLHFGDRVNVDLLGNLSTQSTYYDFSKELQKDKKIKLKAVKKSNVQLEMQTPLVIAQFISLLPIYGTSESDFRNLKLKWKSFKMFYSIIVLLLNFILCAFAVNRYVREQGITFSSLGNIIFYGISFFTSLYFLKLVKDWKDLVSKWAAIQSEMIGFDSSVVKKEIKLITICLFLSSIFEHILSNSQFLLIANENDDLVRMFLSNENIFTITGYNTWFAIIVYLLHFLTTLIWNYPDIFLTAISLSVGNMFKQFNKGLLITENLTSEMSLKYWRRKREVYNSICCLTKMVEIKVSYLVLISFANNMYFICIQLLNSIQPLRSFLEVAYFCTSFGHILFRICSVCYAASSIYENSKEPLTVLFSVPSNQYNCEVERLITQVSTENLALTGCKFFTVTRTLMLTIAGTIITYEVILAQFSGLAEGDRKSFLSTVAGTLNDSSIY